MIRRIQVVNNNLRLHSANVENTEGACMDNIPFWAIFSLTVAFGLTALETGFQLASRLRNTERSLESSSIGTMVQATLALLAFLLAFTFGMSADRANDRRLLVVEEANSIGTTYLRAGYLPEPASGKVREMLKHYVDLRILRSPDQTEVRKVFAASEKIQDEMWNQALQFGKANMNSVVGALFIDSLNQTIDLESKRMAAALNSRVPDTIWIGLYAVVFFGLASLGYQGGKNEARSWPLTTALILSFAVVLTMIVDLDRPSEGFLKTNLSPLIELSKKLHSN